MSLANTQDEHAVANEQMIAEMRSRVGSAIRRSEPPFTNEMNGDAIKNFAYGCGDPNPLFHDDEYAANTPFGTRIAPPCILFAQGVGTLMATAFGMPGLHALYMGTEFWNHKPIRLGDRIVPEFKYGEIDVDEEGSKFAGLRIRQTMDGSFTNQNGELVSESKDHVLRFTRSGGSGRSKYADLEQATYSQEEIDAIDADYAKEHRQGAEPRYWEDVEIGDEVPWVVKGPLTVTDCIGFKIVWGHGPFVRPNRIGFDYRMKHPRAYTKNPFGVPDVPERVHWEDALAQTIGIPAAFDYGPQRVSWFGHLLFNWMGDHGWLEYMNVELHEPILIGDTSWLEGKVVKKWIEDDRHLVEIEHWARDHRGRITTKGGAHIRLPSRG
jgi:acyl dehydratase